MEPDEKPRRLTRSTTDKHVAGVAGGLGRYFGVDPMLFRVAFAVSMVFGGVGVVAYLACAGFMATDDGGPAWIEDRSRATTIAVTVGLCVLAISMVSPAFTIGPGLLVIAALTLLGVAGYRALGAEARDDPARVAAKVTLLVIGTVAAMGAATGVGFIAAMGGGVAVAAISIVAGLGLVTAGLLGGPRWLILPVVVLVLPLAVVSAADIDLQGGVGENAYRPATVAELRPEYRVGLGQVDVDLRDVSFPPGRTEVRVRVGIGEARVRVPAGLCASADAAVGIGAADIPERADEGADIAIREPRRQLVIKANVGVGHLQIDRERDACA